MLIETTNVQPSTKATLTQNQGWQQVDFWSIPAFTFLD
jgi:hypothetical protein